MNLRLLLIAASGFVAVAQTGQPLASKPAAPAPAENPNLAKTLSPVASRPPAAKLASGPAFENEHLRYSINWPSGLSLGEAQLRATRSRPTPKSAEHYEFDLTIEAGVPGFAVADHYHSSASSEFCSIEFDKKQSHGKKVTDEKTTFDPEKNTASRETKDGGKSELSTASCAKDALTFLYFARRELALGRLTPRQPVYFGAAFEVRIEFAGTQMLRLGDNSVEVDHLNGTVKGPASESSFEVYFLKDAARTPALIKVPLSLGAFSMELLK